jgi:hypothetical protein
LRECGVPSASVRGQGDGTCWTTRFGLVGVMLFDGGPWTSIRDHFSGG